MTTEWTKESFITYLRNTLIPDLKESGRDFTAEDFETAIHFMEDSRPVSDERLQDILDNAFDHGIAYWAKIGTSVAPENAEAEWLSEFPLKGGAVTFETEDDEPKPRVLDRAAVYRGLEIMGKKYPRHLADIISQNDDSGTADVLVQCAVFGELIYG